MDRRMRQDLVSLHRDANQAERIKELEAKVERLEQEKATMHENTKTGVGAGVGVKQQLTHLEALCREVVEERDDMPGGETGGTVGYHCKDLFKAIDKLRKEVG